MKKIFAVFLCVFLVFGVLSLPDVFAVHQHTLEFIHEKQATCTTEGNIHHYRCKSCGELFYDCQGKKPLSREDAYIPALGHDWGEWVTVVEPTEKTEGMKVRYCKRDCSEAPLKITIDAGHGPTNNKGYYPGFYEGANNFEIMIYLAEYLREYDGVIVYTTREIVTDNPVNPDRAKLAVDTESEAFISLHSNSADAESACGVSVFRSFIRPESDDLARALGQAIVDTMNADTGITYFRKSGPMIYTEPAYSEDLGDGTTQDYYNVIRNSVVSEKCRYSIILEHGFHTNPVECKWIMDSSNLRKVAKAEAEVIATYFGLKEKGSTAPYTYCKEEQIIPKLPSSSILFGDIDGNGQVDNKDVVMLFKYIGGSNEITIIEDACDVNKDGYVNNKDIVTLFNYISEIN